MKLLALDVGTRRTGVAYGETEADFVIALDTIEHATQEELVEKIVSICKARNIDEIIVGLPLLPGGGEGSQATLVLETVNMLKKASGRPVKTMDERYTSTNAPKGAKDAKSACEMLQIALQKRSNGIDI